MALPDGALWWRLLKKSKNSHCLCAIEVLRNDVKIVARRASRVTHALARTSACFERTLLSSCATLSASLARAERVALAFGGTVLRDQII